MNRNYAGAVAGSQRSSPTPATERTAPMRHSSWQHGRSWSRDDEMRLLDMSISQSIATIARQLGRSTKSIRRKLESLGRSPDTLSGFKCKDLADTLKVSLRQLRRWRARGYLDCVAGRITEDSFERFCRQHPDKIPFGDLDRNTQNWLDSFGYPHTDGYCVTGLAQILGVSRKRIRRWIELNWLHQRGRLISRDSIDRFRIIHASELLQAQGTPRADSFLKRGGT